MRPDPLLSGRFNPICVVTGKTSYGSRNAAKYAARRAKNTLAPGARAFRCECGYWHLGHLPLRVKAGYATRGDVFGGSV